MFCCIFEGRFEVIHRRGLLGPPRVVSDLNRPVGHLSHLGGLFLMHGFVWIIVNEKKGETVMAITYDWYENPVSGEEKVQSEGKELHPRLFLNGKIHLESIVFRKYMSEVRFRRCEECDGYVGCLAGRELGGIAFVGRSRLFGSGAEEYGKSYSAH